MRDDIIVSWTERRTNQSIADELRVRSGILLNFLKSKHYFGHMKRHQTLEKLIPEVKVKGQKQRKAKQILREG